MVIPAIAGTSSRPDSVAVAPVVTWSRSGAKTVTENRQAVVKNIAVLASATPGASSTCSGTIGSAARRSRATKPAERTTRATARLAITGELQA